MSAILDYIEDRLQLMREDLEEARSSGVNSPGFNQTLGAIDELQMLINWMQENEPSA